MGLDGHWFWDIPTHVRSGNPRLHPSNKTVLWLVTLCCKDTSLRFRLAFASKSISLDHVSRRPGEEMVMDINTQLIYTPGRNKTPWPLRRFKSPSFSQTTIVWLVFKSHEFGTILFKDSLVAENTYVTGINLHLGGILPGNGATPM